MRTLEKALADAARRAAEAEASAAAQHTAVAAALAVQADASKALEKDIGATKTALEKLCDKQVDGVKQTAKKMGKELIAVGAALKKVEVRQRSMAEAGMQVHKHLDPLLEGSVKWVKW